MAFGNFKITFNSPVILSFIIISAISLVLGALTGGMTTRMFFTSYPSSWFSPMTYLRMFTYVLGHADSSHFFNNMLLFVLIGPMLEEKYGSKRILIVIAATALVSALVNSIFFTTGILGASGVVFAFIVLASMTSFKEGEIPLTFVIVLILYLGREILNGLFNVDNISQMGHLIGGCCGAVAGFLFQKKYI